MNIEQKIQYEYELLDSVIELDQRSPCVQQVFQRVIRRVTTLERAARYIKRRYGNTKTGGKNLADSLKGNYPRLRPNSAFGHN